MPDASHRVSRRFLVTFVANGVRTVLSLLTWLLIARGLGADDYGHLTFLVGSFAALNLLLDFGTSHAFHTLVSSRPRGPVFFAAYAAWTVLVQWGVMALAISLLLPSSVVDRLWLGHSRPAVLLALTATFLTSQIWAMVSQMGEALRKTLFVQTAAVIQATVHLAFIVVAVRTGWLSVTTVLWALIAEYLVLVVAIGPTLLAGNVARGRAAGGSTDRFTSVVSEFLVFCRPLAIFGSVGLLYTFADRWLLQNFGGARQQGLFSIGQQISTVSLLATTSILDVFWKEIAEARAAADSARATELYTAVRHALFFYTAWISCGAIPHAQAILAWTVGGDYAGAWLPLTIMLVYPVHQSLSLVQSTFAYASGRPSTYTRAGIVTMAISLPVTYVLVAPSTAPIPGFDLGAVGLSLKMVLLQVLSVVLVARWLVRENDGWSHDYGYQVKVLAFLLAISVACRWLSASAIELAGFDSDVAVVGLSTVLYTAICMAAVYRVPSAAGLSRAQVERAMRFPARWLYPAAQS